jgi:disulfide bond formation protein DsbB
MSTDTVVLFFALLTVLVHGCFVVGLVLWAKKSTRIALVRSVGPVAMILAAAITTTATLGSLYLSEVANFTPCVFCWYQRIAMYPAALLLVMGSLRRDVTIRPYVATLAVIGVGLSAYHVLLERFPSLESASSCDPNNPCSLRWVDKFGYITIPAMALTAFTATLLLLGLHTLYYRSNSRTKGQHE